MADEQVVIEFVIKTETALRNAEGFRRAVDEIKNSIRKSADETKKSFDDIGRGMKIDLRQTGLEQLRDAFQRLGLPTVANDTKSIAYAKQLMSQAITQATGELKKESAELEKNKAETSAVGDVIKTAFGVGLGQIAVLAIRTFINILKDAVQAGADFTKAIFGVEIAARALRRAGIDIIAQDIYNNIDALQKKFGVFSKTELVQGSAALLNLVRDMGFTKEQIFSLQEAVASLAIVNGRSMEDVQRTVALALSSGYTEGLQRLGVSINRVTIAHKAAEMGYSGNYMSLTEVQRAAATYALILEKVAYYSQDVAKWQETLGGQLDKLSAQQTDNKRIIGEMLLPANVAWKAITVELGSILVWFTLTVLAPMAIYIKLVVDLLMTFNKIDFSKGFKKNADIIAESLNKAMGDYDKWKAALTNAAKTGSTKELEKLLAPDFVSSVPVGTAMQDRLDEEAETITKARKDMFDDIGKLDREYQRDQRDAQIDYFRDIDKINRDTFAKQMGAYDDFLKRKQSKQKDTDTQINRLTEKYNLDVLQANRQFATRMEESEAKYREKQLKAELDYQEKLRKLREGFLFDLEDALRERDARQILRLIRQYNLQREQTSRDYSAQKDEMARQRALEVQELINQRNERLRVLQEEFELRIRQIQAQTAAEIEAERQSALARMDEIAAQAQREKDERKIKLDQQLADLSTHLQDRYDELVVRFAEENKLTAEKLDEQMKIYEAAYGPNGRLERAIRYAIAQIQAMSAVISGLSSVRVNVKTLSPIQQANITTSPTNVNQIQKANFMQQEGGTLFANRPTTVTFGEGGEWEMAKFTPLGHLGKDVNKMSMGNFSPTGIGGEIGIAITLSPDLEARIINNTLGKTANVILELQRSR